jgi:hypothetical protein
MLVTLSSFVDNTPVEKRKSDSGKVRVLKYQCPAVKRNDNDRCSVLRLAIVCSPGLRR